MMMPLRRKHLTLWLMFSIDGDAERALVEASAIGTDSIESIDSFPVRRGLSDEFIS